MAYARLYPVTLLASAARTTTVTGDAVTLLPGLARGPERGIAFVLDVTAAATDVGDTLDVKVQTMLGANWVDVAAFTQVLGNGGTKRHFCKIVATEPQAVFENGTALTAGTVRHLLGAEWRAIGTIVNAGTVDVSFTFSVVAIPQ